MRNCWVLGLEKSCSPLSCFVAHQPAQPLDINQNGVFPGLIFIGKQNTSFCSRTFWRFRSFVSYVPNWFEAWIVLGAGDQIDFDCGNWLILIDRVNLGSLTFYIPFKNDFWQYRAKKAFKRTFLHHLYCLLNFVLCSKLFLIPILILLTSFFSTSSSYVPTSRYLLIQQCPFVG